LLRAHELGPTGIRALVVHLRSLLRFLEFSGHLGQRLSNSVPRLVAPLPPPPPDTLEPKQLRQLLNSFPRHTPQGRRDYAIVLCLAQLALRSQEVVSLTLDDVDWQQSLLIIRESKFGKTRFVPLHQSALPPLRTYARRRQKLFPLAPYFFVSEAGNRLARSTVGRIFTQLREGIPFSRRPPRLHDLRHTMASEVLRGWQSSRKGAANRILILSRYLGHSHVEYTFWYLTALPQLLADAAQRFVLDEPEDL
jgi:integrase